jgi:hypothetical protein
MATVPDAAVDAHIASAPRATLFTVIPEEFLIAQGPIATLLELDEHVARLA